MKSLREIYDISKMKEEDRRHIISYASNSAMFNESNRLINTSLFISLVAFLISVFSLIYSIQNGFNYFVISLFIIEIFFLVILLYLYICANKRTKKILENLIKDHNNFFEYHYNYAKRK